MLLCHPLCSPGSKLGLSQGHRVQGSEKLKLKLLAYEMLEKPSF